MFNTAKKQWKKIQICLLPALAFLLQLSSPAISHWFTLTCSLLLHRGLPFLPSDAILRAAWERNVLVFGSLKALGTFEPSEFQLALAIIHYGKSYCQNFHTQITISSYRLPELRTIE